VIRYDVSKLVIRAIHINILTMRHPDGPQTAAEPPELLIADIRKFARSL